MTDTDRARACARLPLASTVIARSHKWPWPQPSPSHSRAPLVFSTTSAASGHCTPPSRWNSSDSCSRARATSLRASRRPTLAVGATATMSTASSNAATTVAHCAAPGVSMTRTRSSRTPRSAAATRFRSGTPTTANHPSAPRASAHMAMASDHAPCPFTTTSTPRGKPPHGNSGANGSGIGTVRCPAKVTGLILARMSGSSSGRAAHCPATLTLDGVDPAIPSVSNTCSCFTTWAVQHHEVRWHELQTARTSDGANFR